MAKTNAERQRLYRARLLNDKVKAEEIKKKARLRDNKRRKDLDRKSLENLRSRQREASKRCREKKKLKHLANAQPSTYTTRQTLGKAVQRTLRALPKDPQKRDHVVHHVAQLLNLIPQSNDQHKREQRSLSIDLKKAVRDFYTRDDISYQLPGKRDSIVIRDEADQRTTVQKRILLFNIRETYQLFLAERTASNDTLSLSSFADLRPKQVLVQSKMSHRSCLCSYHENVNLLLKALSKHVDCPALSSLQTFSSALVCDEQNEDCMFNRCDSCLNHFRTKIQTKIIDPQKQIPWFQWTAKKGFWKKEEFAGSVKNCIIALKEQVKPFLRHVFIKRRQSNYFEELKSNLNDETICIQVDFSENFRIDIQDSIQSSFYTKDFVSLFTCYIWHTHGGLSRVYVSDDLSHDKYYVDSAIYHLLNDIKQQFSPLKQIHFFSDGAAQQFKQKYLFRNLCRLSEQFGVSSAGQSRSITSSSSSNI